MQTRADDDVFQDTFLDRLKDLFGLREWIREACYRVKCWVFRPYTTIKPRYCGHTLIARRELLPLVMFEVLSQFIERECSPGCVDWVASDHRINVTLPNGKVVNRNVRDEMRDLYYWWHQKFNGRYNEVADQLWAERHEHAAKHQASMFYMKNGLRCFDPFNYDTPENRAYAKALCQLANFHERAMERALDNRLRRLLAVRPYMWT